MSETGLALPRLSAPLQAVLRGLRRYFPLTFAGTLAFAAGIYFLAAGFMLENIYAILLGFLVPLGLILLALLGRLQALRFEHASVRWDSSQTLIARRPDLAEKVEVGHVKTFFFYRVHARVRGLLRTSTNAFLRIRREAASIGGGTVAIPLDLPLSGILSSHGTTAVRDVFGLTRSRFGADYAVVRPVLPQSVRETERMTIAATGGNEEQNRRARQDEEKYFMREYLPGDKARDINWKASSRLAKLITRISPYTQEKSQVIHIELRPYRRERPDTLDSVAHLNRIKSRLVSFMRVMRQEHPEYSFDVCCGETKWLVRTDEEIEGFARDLAAVFYRPDPGRTAAELGSQLLIFTTPFDERLAGSLGSYGKTVLHILTTTAPEPGRRAAADPEPLYEALFSVPRIDPPLPGRWALRREPARSRLKGHAAADATVTAEPIAVSLFGAKP